MPSDDKKAVKETSIMKSGACGAFVHGLEDEFMEVREAGVDALCELASQNGVFAAMVSDFLVDMFNDEIESVRINSVNSLIKISQYVNLREDQLDTVLNLLSDFSWEIRELVRSLLAHCEMATKPCLHAAILGLMNNLQKYPQDCASIWSCLKDLAAKHTDLAVSLIPELLNIHPYFAMPDASLDDNAYMGFAIFIFNAALRSPVVLSILPEYAKRHYDYLRDSIPHLVPELRDASHSNVSTNPQNGRSVISNFIKATLSRLSTFPSTNPSNSIIAIRTAMKDMQQVVSSAGGAPLPAASFYVMFLDALCLLLQAKTHAMWSTPSLAHSGDHESLQMIIRKLLLISYRLEHAFSGANGAILTGLRQIRIFAHVLLAILSWQTFGHHSDGVSNVMRQLKMRLSRHRRDTPDKDAYTAAMELNSPTDMMVELRRLFLTHTLDVPSFVDHMRHSFVTITEPSGESDHVALKFTAGLSAAIPLDATLENVDATEMIFVKVVYQDGKVELFKPKPCEIRSFGPLRHRLVTDVIVNHHTWSAACRVQLSVVSKYNGDIDEGQLDILGDSSHQPNVCVNTAVADDDLAQGLISLCAPVVVNLLPK